MQLWLSWPASSGARSEADCSSVPRRILTHLPKTAPSFRLVPVSADPTCRATNAGPGGLALYGTLARYPSRHYVEARVNGIGIRHAWLTAP